MGSPYQYLVEKLFRRVYGRPFDSGLPDWKRGEGNEMGPSTIAENCSGLVLMADGVGGLDLCGTALKYVMGSLGSTLAVSVVPWGHGLGRWHSDLTRVPNRDLWARRMADAALSFHKARADAPIFMVAKSGGSGIVIKALELLPANLVDRAVLLAPALSPDYDLTRALRAVRREVYTYWSPLDVVVLGAGTRIFGTIDRSHSVSAGLVGFREPKNGEGYAKLRQIRWQPSMMRAGYFGGHMGPDSPAFLRIYVAPLLRPEDAAGS